MGYQIQVRDGIVEVVTQGDADVDVFQKFLREALALKEWKPGTSFLHDHSNLCVGSLTVDDARLIAKIWVSARNEIGAGRLAIVSNSDLVFGLARMWQVFVVAKWGGSEFVFRTKEEALHWLKQQ